MSIKPPRIKPGDKIAIIAPAGPVDPPDIQPAIDLLGKEGYEIVPSPHLFYKHGYLAGTDDARLEDLHAVFNDKSIKAVLCARGGYGTLRILDKIDYNLIRDNPKIILGYSDITALLLAIYKETGLVTFHGPVARDLCDNNNRNLESFINSVSGQWQLEIDLSDGAVLTHGIASGPVLGGNLSLVAHMMGTPFMPAVKNSILFIEEKGESPYRVDRLLTHLRLGGLFKKIAGLLIGSFIECGEMEEINEIFSDLTVSGGVPVFNGFPVGHGVDNVVVPIGLDAELDTFNMKLIYKEPCVTV